MVPLCRSQQVPPRSVRPAAVDATQVVLAAGAAGGGGGWPRMDDASQWRRIENSKIGEGAFGAVVQAEDLATGEIVAVKKVRLRSDEQERLRLAREILALRRLEHPNVVRLRAVYPEDFSIMVVFDLMHSDLRAWLARSSGPLSGSAIKGVMLQLLRGVAYCHAQRVLHRDLKPANLLISRDGILKLADFGLARLDAADGRPYSHQVATRWYRSPELLYGAQHYDGGCDLWAVGCIFAELLNHEPLFAGEHDIDQLGRVISVLGSPREETWPEVVALPDFGKISFPETAPLPWEDVLTGPEALPAAQTLCSSLLSLNPAHRPSATDALKAEYFLCRPVPDARLEILDGL